MTISEGDKIPDVTVTGLDGQPLKLTDFAGAPFVLYFYPRDDTPGCTKEAQGFSALAADFAQAGAKLLGISQDSPAKHQKFIDKYQLAIPLATDAEAVALAAFGAWVEKNMYGRTYMGIERSTFLFDASGTLVKAWRKVKVPGHAEAVLAAVKALA